MKYIFSAPVPLRKGWLFSVKNGLFVLMAAAVMLAVSACGTTDCADTPPGFVHLAEAVPDAILEVRYYFPRTTSSGIASAAMNVPRPCSPSRLRKL